MFLIKDREVRALEHNNFELRKEVKELKEQLKNKSFELEQTKVDLLLTKKDNDKLIKLIERLKKENEKTTEADK